MEIENIKISDLIPYVNNSRTHSDEQILQIAASIKEFGFTNPVLIDSDNGIIAGHGRCLGAKKLSMDEVPAIRLPNLSEAQKKAYIIADNKLALNAGWDEELLKIEIEELNDLDFDIDLLGFDADELGLILVDDEIVEGLTDEDEVPEIQDDPISKRGDIWVLGNHRLMCGDSTSIDDVYRLMDGNDYDVCIFDPPYDLEDLYKTAMPEKKDGAKLVVMWDFKRFALAPSSALNCGWNPLYEFIWDNVQSWYTPNRPLARHKAIGIFGDNPFFDTEKAIIHDGKERKAHKVKNTRGECDYVPLDGAKHIATVEAFSNAQQTDEHGHGKPVAWLQAIYSGIGGKKYLDLFGGSGASMIVCEKLKKQCYMMELDTTYCDQIIKRWQNFTGNKAVNLSTGVEFYDKKP